MKRKLVSLVLAGALCLGLASPALATGERVPISGRCRVEAKSAFLHRLSHTAFDAIK